MHAMITDLPHEGEWNLSTNKIHEATIVLVHHFGGSKRTLLRHARLLNELGYNCVRFNLKFNMTEAPQKISLTGDFKIGLRRIWADQIQDVLNVTPGPKIIYSFSMPGAAAVEAISRRKAYQILGLVCDSGPFLQIVKATWRLYEISYKIENSFVRGFYTLLSFSMWGLKFRSEIKGYFSEFPKGFRILSIRGGADRLVPPLTIDEFFSLALDCQVEVLDLPDADHLEGLKKFSQIYVARVKSFLESLEKQSRNL